MISLGVAPNNLLMPDAMDGTELTRLDLADVRERYGFPYVVIHRTDLHAALANGFGLGVEHIGSEYGMAELTSQGWAPSGGRYAAPPWMRVRALDTAALDRGEVRDVPPGAAGRLAVVDLGNVQSCPFLLTEDDGCVHADGTFEVIGRVRGSALRGCNFLTET